MSDERIAEIYKTALDMVGISQHSDLEVRGTTIYFNVYDKTTGSMMEFYDPSGKRIDNLYFGVKKQAKTIDKNIERKRK